jgi:plastocyanin
MPGLRRAKCFENIGHSRCFYGTEQWSGCYARGMHWLAWALVAGGVLAPGAADAAEIRIEMREAAYAPAEIRGREGDTLTFVNHDAVPHQPFVPTTGWGVNLGDVEPGGKAGLPLRLPGRFEIECAYHPGMRATVVVDP